MIQLFDHNGKPFKKVLLNRITRLGAIVSNGMQAVDLDNESRYYIKVNR